MKLSKLPERSHDRSKQIAELIQHELATALTKVARDPRFATVNVVTVDLAPDYSNAKIFVTLLDEKEKASIMTALNKAAGFFRSHLARSIQIRSTPKLTFIFDEQLRKAEYLSRLIDSIPVVDDF